ncbi:MAG: hypothetical protein L0Y39_09150 [Methylococcaceae bacterium]|nr:hypothetical protein [Methylococcaceae bacterium]
MKQVEYDLHLAAAQISLKTVTELSALGFCADGFTNYVRCETGEYHASYNNTMSLPDDGLWERVCLLIENDGNFSGYLEMEEEPLELRCALVGERSCLPILLPPLSPARCPSEISKACDLHIGVDLSESTIDAIERMNRMEVSAVDKKTSRGVRRVYTVTFESTGDGERAFSILRRHLTTAPGLRGKMKLERVVKCFRKPLDATTLPIVTGQAAQLWFGSINSSLMPLDARST